ncbi:hypothetical protein OV079_42100 [Nannocystis pusilla]|uniref:Uncharacterized protein n=1 Tax=Nannocystis pusilla TaxID=889268 RepID=A0A9X3EXU0_9BACT|nr:hypothetical protein [Nannocystis pusilla]MCY1012031.1 hypothetical protein [Nannocystis pusilla]
MMHGLVNGVIAVVVGANPAADPFAGEVAAPVVDRSRIDVPSADGPEWEAPPPPLPPPPPAPLPPQADVAWSEPAYVDSPARPEVVRREPEPEPESVPVDDGKPLIKGGLVVLGCAAASAAGSLYSWHLHGQSEERLAVAEVNNEAAQMFGLPLEDTSGLRGEVRLYRGRSIGLAVTAGVLLITGGSVALAGVRKRNRARNLVIRPTGGLGLEVKF